MYISGVSVTNSVGNVLGGIFASILPGGYVRGLRVIGKPPFESAFFALTYGSPDSLVQSDRCCPRVDEDA
jgi:hypothetical protein